MKKTWVGCYQILDIRLSCRSKLSEPFGICFTFKLDNNQETYFYFDQKTNNVILSELIVNGVIKRFKHNTGKADYYINSLIDILKHYVVVHIVTDTMSVDDIILDYEEDNDIPFIFNGLLSVDGDFNNFFKHSNFLDVEHEFCFQYTAGNGLNIDSVLSVIYWRNNNRVDKLHMDKIFMSDQASIENHLNFMKSKAKEVAVLKLSAFHNLTVEQILELDNKSFENLLDVFKMDLI